MFEHKQKDTSVAYRFVNLGKYSFTRATANIFLFAKEKKTFELDMYLNALFAVYFQNLGKCFFTQWL